MPRVGKKTEKTKNDNMLFFVFFFRFCQKRIRSYRVWLAYLRKNVYLCTFVLDFLERYDGYEVQLDFC